MILAPHILLGAAIGSKISNPLAVFALGFASHYFLDALPHYDYEVPGLKAKEVNYKKILTDLTKVATDASCGLALALILIWHSPYLTNALIGMFGAVLPDALLYLSWHYPKSKFLKIFSWPQNACHYLKNLSPAWLDLSTEIVVCFAAIFFLFYAI